MLVVVAIGGSTLIAGSTLWQDIQNPATPAHAQETETLRFDVAEDATRFVFDESPVHDNGLPAYGNSFITRGYLYEAGTLDGSNGVLPDGSPEFPDKVIGA